MKHRILWMALFWMAVLSACGSSSGSGDNEEPPLNPVDIRLTPVFGDIVLERPLLLLQAPGNDQRWYVVEQGGLVKTFRSGDASATVFADLGNRVAYTGGADERGLLGMAFHPDFPADRRVFLNWVTTDGGQRTVIASFTTDAQGLAIDPASERIVLEVDQPAANHNGGHIAFGPDGYLYVGLGDGGGSNDTYRNAQNPLTLLGSMLRIDIDVATGGYAIPPGNPFVGNADVRDEIWAYGLRNPWRWSFDRETGALYAGDVGQGALEEIDRIEPGRQYGWPCFEGTRDNNSAGYGDYCAGVVNTPPIHEYPRSEGIAVVGGHVYRGSDPALESLRGRYFFADYGSGRLWSIYPLDGDPASTLKLQAESGRVISSLAEDLAGRLYLIDWAGGGILRIDAK
jgi:glucose/arabinose dehydrogenase